LKGFDEAIGLAAAAALPYLALNLIVLGRGAQAEQLGETTSGVSRMSRMGSRKSSLFSATARRTPTMTSRSCREIGCA
jgi:hypothetical protein